MRYLIIGIIAVFVLGIVVLYFGARWYVAREAIKDAAAIAEYRQNVTFEFVPPVEDDETEEIPADEELSTPQPPMSLEAWLAFNERDWLRMKAHEYCEEFNNVEVKLRRSLWALTETTMEWPQEWVDQLDAMLAEKEMSHA